MPFLDRNSNNKQRLRRNAQRMRTSALTGSIDLDPGGGIENGPDGLEIDLDGKGDLLTSDGTNVVTLSPGPNGSVLTADSGEAKGLKWTQTITQEQPSGLINGTNDTFGLAYPPVTGTVELTVNGITQTEGASYDFTITGSTITFTAGSIPQTSDIVRVNYRT